VLHDGGEIQPVLSIPSLIRAITRR
jgi:hypothetical protein